MNLPITVLHTHPEDGVANALRGRPGVQCVHLDDVSMHWEMSEGRVAVDARYPQSLRDKFDGAYVINRIFDLNNSEVGRRLHSADLHGLWGYIALSGLLGSAGMLAHENGSRGVSRSLLPLNSQWFAMAARCPDIEYPRFEFGFGRVDPDISALRNPMQKSVWSYFAWKSETSLDDEERDWHRFYVDRPVGTPVICIYHGEQMFLRFPRGEVAVDPALYKRVAACARSVFASQMGEVLMYERSHSAPMFCAFSPYMANASRDSMLASLLLGTGITRVPAQLS